jgi:hypothetical protein
VAVYFPVPSKNKQDQRTIEQVMAESRARKKQKISAENSDENYSVDGSSGAPT